MIFLLKADQQHEEVITVGHYMVDITGPEAEAMLHRIWSLESIRQVDPEIFSLEMYWNGGEWCKECDELDELCVDVTEIDCYDTESLKAIAKAPKVKVDYQTAKIYTSGVIFFAHVMALGYMQVESEEIDVETLQYIVETYQDDKKRGII